MDWGDDADAVHVVAPGVSGPKSGIAALAIGGGIAPAHPVCGVSVLSSTPWLWSASLPPQPYIYYSTVEHGRCQIESRFLGAMVTVMRLIRYRTSLRMKSPLVTVNASQETTMDHH